MKTTEEPVLIPSVRSRSWCRLQQLLRWMDA